MDDTPLHVVEFLKKENGPLPDNIWQDIEDVTDKTYTPCIKEAAERPCEVSDFEKYLPYVERRLQNILIVLKAIKGTLGVDKTLAKRQAVNILLLCGEHSCQEKWTTNQTLLLCKDLLQILCTFWHCNSLSELLNGAEYEALFSSALLVLRPKLLKSTWKTYPAAVSCYQWLLFHVKVRNY